MKDICECCGELKYGSKHWDRTTGMVCGECKIWLLVAETALNQAGICGAVIDPPQQQKAK